MVRSATPPLLLLALLVALGPLTTDMYLASLPDMAQEFGVSPGVVQLTLSVYLISWACFMLITGPFSDYYGRRPAILVGVSIYVVASLICALAQHFEVLLFGRFLQAVGAAFATVVGRAVVRDYYDGAKAAQLLALMGACMAVVPALSPILGGYLHIWFDWRANFIAMTITGVLCLGVFGLFFGETLPKDKRVLQRLGDTLSAYRTVLADRIYLGYTACVSFSVAGSFAFVFSSPFVFQDVFKLQPNDFGFYFGIVVVGFICGTLSGRYLSGQFSIPVLALAGSVIAVASSSMMLMFAVLDMGTLFWVTGLQMMYYFSIGVLGPQCTAGALSPYPYLAGTASSLINFLPVAIGAASGFLGALAFDGSPMPMALAIFCCAVSGILFFYFLVIRAEPIYDKEEIKVTD